MKILNLKWLVLALICSLNLNNIHAQVDSEEPEPGSSITPDPNLLNDFVVPVTTPKVKSSSVIFYSDGISAAVEFEAGGIVPQYAFLADKNNPSDIRTLNLSAGKAELFGLAPGKTYDIKTNASNGQQYIVGSVNTTPYKAGEPVVVSENLYRALSQYVANGSQTTTLSNYLKQLNQLSQHEKIAFLQQYIMNGATLPSSIKGQYPDNQVKTALNTRKAEGECICNFVMNQVTVAVPDETGNFDFKIGPKVSITNPTFYNNSSFWLRALISQGAAKRQLLASAGTTAGNKRRTETWVSGGESVSDNFVRIGYHLMCVGITELPKECDCEKTIKYDFGYSTNIEARTNVSGPCILNKEGSAMAQDWAVAVVTREKVNSVNDVQVLQSGVGIATSKCSGGVPVSVLIDAAKIGVCVFQLVKSVKTVQLNDVVNQTNEIIDKVGAVLTTITEPKDCNSAIIEKPLVQGVANITFRPNDPLSFMLVSGSSLEVMGLRCWDSSASIKSSFHLAGVVDGGAPSSNTSHCCTNYFSNWAYASQNGDENNRINSINYHLSLNSPGGWQTVNGLPNSGSINIPTAVGYAIGVNLPNGQRCAKEIPIFNNPH